jgi:hypothetical protein
LSDEVYSYSRQQQEEKLVDENIIRDIKTAAGIRPQSFKMTSLEFKEAFIKRYGPGFIWS